MVPSRTTTRPLSWASHIRSCTSRRGDVRHKVARRDFLLPRAHGSGGRRPRPAPSAQPRVRWRTPFRGWHLCAGGYVLPTSPCGTREVSGETASARQDEVVVPPPVRGGSATPRCHTAGRRGDRRRRTAPRTNRCPARRNRPGRLTAPPPGPARSPSLGRSRELRCVQRSLSVTNSKAPTVRTTAPPSTGTASRSRSRASARAALCHRPATVIATLRRPPSAS